MHQIKTAKQAGYEESKISSAVIGSMTPSFTFRNELLSKCTPFTFRNAHFSVQNANDPYNSLTSMVQYPQEPVYEFTMRCTEVRQKLIKASDII